jgi:phosphate transport system substrate-binding protein
MSFPSYFWRGLLGVAVLWPLAFMGLAIAAGFLSFVASGGVLTIVALLAAGIFLVVRVFLSGRKLVEGRENIPRNVLSRYLPVLLPTVYTLVIAFTGLNLPVPTEDALFQSFANLFSNTHPLTSLVVNFALLFSPPNPWFYLAPPLSIYLVYAVGMWAGLSRARVPRCPLPASGALLLVLALTLGGVVRRGLDLRAQVWSSDSYATRGISEEVNINDYRPFSESRLLVKVPEPTLTITSNFPILDGATAAFPIYAAAAEAIYRNVPAAARASLVDSNKTSRAYERLFRGEADLIFVAQPSAQQSAAAREAGIELRLIPIAREAFVFFVPEGNPVKGLTQDQIRRIYTRQVWRWREVGGPDLAIHPFQRPEGSGSQTALLKLVMGDQTPAPPQMEEYAEGMGEIMRRVAGYRDMPGAIGFSFRYFATTMNAQAGLRLLEIDGIAPTRENIRNGTYPYTTDLYIATVGSLNPRVAALIDWFRGPQGQKLIEDTGYVGVATP